MTTTYTQINDHIRVAITDDSINGTITHTLESRSFDYWSPQQNITTYYNVI